MHRATLRFNASRPVLVRDVRRLRAALVAAGYTSTFLERAEGGITVNGDGDGPDVRFTSRNCALGPFWHKMGSMDADVVFIDHVTGLAEFDTANKFNVVICDRATSSSIVPDQMISDVADAVGFMFDALPHVIANERRRATDSDSTRDVNIHHGYDYKAALLKWAMPHARFPGERMLPCFVCKEWRRAFDFEWSVADMQEHCFTEFELVIGCFEFNNAPCCLECMIDRTRSNTMRPMKRPHAKTRILQPRAVSVRTDYV
jgi:hypothetical protein